MYCYQCGKELYEGNFCVNCGAAVVGQVATADKPTEPDMPTGVIDFLPQKRTFCNAVTSWKNTNIAVSSVTVLLSLMSIAIIAASLGKNAKYFGYDAGSVTWQIFGLALGLAASIIYATWLSGYICKPMDMLEGTQKYFSQLTYEKKTRFGMSFSGRVKFIYVSSIITIIGVCLMAFSLLVSLFLRLQYAKLFGFVGWWEYVIVPLIQILLALALVLPAAIQIVKAYKDFCLAFGAISPEDHYVFEQKAKISANAQTPSAFSPKPAPTYASKPRNSDWTCRHCSYSKNPKDDAKCRSCGKYK